MNRRDFTLALGGGAAAASGAGLVELGVAAGGAPAVDEQRIRTFLLLREMLQQTLANMEVNRKALIEQIAKLDTEIESERQK
jgi:hypothetical protein